MLFLQGSRNTAVTVHEFMSVWFAWRANKMFGPNSKILSTAFNHIWSRMQGLSCWLKVKCMLVLGLAPNVNLSGPCDSPKCILSSKDADVFYDTWWNMYMETSVHCLWAKIFFQTLLSPHREERIQMPHLRNGNSSKRLLKEASYCYTWRLIALFLVEGWKRGFKFFKCSFACKSREGESKLTVVNVFNLLWWLNNYAFKMSDVEN